MMKEPTRSFTKYIMSMVMLLYFAGAFIGGVMVVIAAIVDIQLMVPVDSAMFIAYAAYLGGPTATAIGFYAWKSKAENLLKIKNSSEITTSSKPVDIQILANMGGNT